MSTEAHWSEDLPFHATSFLRKLIAARKLFYIGFALSLLLATIGASLIGKTWWRVETSMLYTLENVGEEQDGLTVPSLETMSNLVLTNESLEKLLTETSSELSLQEAKRKFEVSTDPNQSLLRIGVRSTNKEETAVFANSMREIFLEQIEQIRSIEAHKLIGGYENEITRVRSEIEKIENNLQAFRRPDTALDIDQESQHLLKEYKELESLIREAEVGQRTKKKQLEELAAIRKRLKSQVAAEEEEASQMANIFEVKARSDRLREKIRDDKLRRSNHARLIELEAKYNRTKRLHEKGILSKQQLETVQAEYESHRALSVDTEEIEEMRGELEELDKVTLPKNSSSTATQPLMRRMLEQSFQLELDLTALDERLIELKTKRENLSRMIKDLPKLQAQHSALKRDLEGQEESLKRLMQLRDLVQSLLEAEGAGFTLVSQARQPETPELSTGLFIFAGIFLLSIGLVVFAIASLTLFQGKVCTVGDIAHWFKLPVLGEIPADGSSQESVIELARSIRRSFPERGATLLFCDGAEETSAVATLREQLTTCFSLLDERVLCIDLCGNESTLLGDVEDAKGLGDYLSFRCTEPEYVVHRTSHMALDYVPRGDWSFKQELLHSHRMQDFLQELQQKYTLILIFAPPAEQSQESRALSEYCSATVFFLHSGNVSLASVSKNKALLEKSNAQIGGFALYDVKPIYSQIM